VLVNIILLLLHVSMPAYPCRARYCYSVRPTIVRLPVSPYVQRGTVQKRMI